MNIGKFFIGGVLQIFEHELLNAKVGQKILGGHATVLEVGEHSVNIEIDINDGFQYTMVITRKTEAPAETPAAPPAAGTPGD